MKMRSTLQMPRLTAQQVEAEAAREGLYHSGLLSIPNLPTILYMSVHVVFYFVVLMSSHMGKAI